MLTYDDTLLLQVIKNKQDILILPYSSAVRLPQREAINEQNTVVKTTPMAPGMAARGSKYVMPHADDEGHGLALSLGHAQDAGYGKADDQADDGIEDHGDGGHQGHGLQPFDVQGHDDEDDAQQGQHRK